MSEPGSPHFPTGEGFLTRRIQDRYVDHAIAQSIFPAEARDSPDILSLVASSDLSKPIQFWQLYSVLGQAPIVAIVSEFYGRVFDDEDWFRSVFERVGGVEHHIVTQASMWIDVMGGGPFYHGGEFRLNFHHTHNAIQLMNEKGAHRWVELMVAALDRIVPDVTDDVRVRPALNTFLSYFFAKYAEDFGFENRESFGRCNAPISAGPGAPS